MTTLNLFTAVLSALLVNEAVQKIIDEVSWRLHKRTHDSIFDRLERLGKAEDVE
jgi:hypothetical protein